MVCNGSHLLGSCLESTIAPGFAAFDAGMDGLNAVEGKGLEVLPPLHNSPPVRRRKSLGPARKSRDTDSHPLSLKRKNSLDSDISGMRRNSLDDISEEISAALATGEFSFSQDVQVPLSTCFDYTQRITPLKLPSGVSLLHMPGSRTDVPSSLPCSYNLPPMLHILIRRICTVCGFGLNS